MVTSDFRPEVEIRPFCPCAMKNTQYNAYLWPNRRNFRDWKENWGRGTRRWGQILHGKWKYSRFMHAPCIRP